MICNMQFVHDGISLTVSELNETQKVAVFTQADNDPVYGHFIELEKDQLVLLRDWLNKQIELIE